MKKAVNKSLAFLLAAVMVFGAAPLSGFAGLDLHMPEWAKSPFSFDADAESYENFTYSVSDGKAVITSCKPKVSGELIIPVKLEGYEVIGIADQAFNSCISLSTIKFAENSKVTSIGKNAFLNCKNLTSIEIPSGVTSIGAKAFDSCYKLKSITVAADNANYSGDIRGALFNKNKTALIQYPIGCKETSYSIPSGVTNIGNYAFYECYYLSSIEIPSSVTSIGVNAFYNTAFYSDSSNWVDDVLYIDKYLIEAKKSKSGLCTVKSGTKLIADYAFYMCRDLTSIELPSDVTSIGSHAFYDCGNLARLHIPKSLTTIGLEMLSSGSACKICSESATAYAKTYAQTNGFTFELCVGHGASTVQSTGVTVSSTSRTLKVDSMHQLKATVSPANATYKNVTWKSSNPAVATVTSIGLVTAKSAGTATITVTTVDSGKTATCEITVLCPTVSIKNLNTSAVVKYGDTLRLTVDTTDMPEGAKVVWSVQGTGVKLVPSADGISCDITSTESGTVTVTAKIVDADGKQIKDGDGNDVSASQQVESKAGFFQKLIAFFKKLFGLTKTIVQVIDE